MISAKEVWDSLYKNELEVIWQSERGAMRKPAMLHYVLTQELEKLQESLAGEIKQFEDQKILSMEDGKSKEGSEISLSENELSKSPIINKHDNISFSRPLPKLLLLKNENRDVDMVKSSTEENKLFIPTNVGVNANIAKLSSIIENYPGKSLIKKTNKTVVRRNQKNNKSSTLTQQFNFKPTSNFISNKTKLLDLPSSSCIKLETNKSKAVSANETSGAVKMETMSTTLKDVRNPFKDYDEFPFVKPKSPLFVHKTKPVRRKADRMKLPGWSCEDCRKFYESLNLSPEELRKRMNSCSKHRSKFDPNNKTFKGFCDIKMFFTQDEDN